MVPHKTESEWVTVYVDEMWLLKVSIDETFKNNNMMDCTFFVKLSPVKDVKITSSELWVAFNLLTL